MPWAPTQVAGRNGDGQREQEVDITPSDGDRWHWSAHSTCPLFANPAAALYRRVSQPPSPHSWPLLCTTPSYCCPVPRLLRTTAQPASPSKTHLATPAALRRCAACRRARPRCRSARPRPPAARLRSSASCRGGGWRGWCQSPTAAGCPGGGWGAAGWEQRGGEGGGGRWM